MRPEYVPIVGKKVRYHRIARRFIEEPRRFGDTNLCDLRDLLATSKTEDAYCKSYLYYAVTGRGEVWAIPHLDAWIICTRHPNVDDTVLLFFPFAYAAAQFEEQISTLRDYESFLAECIGRPLRGTDKARNNGEALPNVQLARVPNAICGSVFSAGKHVIRDTFELELINETKLDWVFPSYDVSLSALAARRGAEFACFRNKINKFRSQGVEVYSLAEVTAPEVRAAIRDVSVSCANSRIGRGGSTSCVAPIKDEFLDPYMWLATLNCEEMIVERLNIGGVFLKRGDKYIAFSLWEQVIDTNATVPSIVALPSSYEKGLPEYLRLQMVKAQLACGYKRMCIGGSETEGLDRFKRKFAPVAAHHLRTIKLTFTAA